MNLCQIILRFSDGWDRILKLFSFFAFYLNKIIVFQCGNTMGIFLHQFVFSVRYLSVSWSVSEPMWPSLHFLRSVECQLSQILRVCAFYDSTCFCLGSRPMSCNTHSKDKAHWSFSEYRSWNTYFMRENIQESNQLNQIWVKF